MNIDERLEELARAKGGREYVLTRTLIQALLRARKLLSLWHSKAHEGAPCTRVLELCPALDDTELEEVL